MKSKLILIGAFIGLFVFMSFGCSNTPAPSVSTNVPSESITVHGMDLDAAIREAATQMETRISSGTMVALVSVASPSNAFSTQVLTRLESAIVSNGKLVVVDRANLDKVREEQGFQLSGEVDDASATSIGRLLGAGAIVTGSLTDLGDVYSLALKAINIETATVAVSYLADLTKTARIETLLATRDNPTAVRTQPTTTSTSQQQAPALASNSAPVPVAPSAPLTPVYRIGDIGPAGGIIFYDKGNDSGGWRYLEVAPAYTDREPGNTPSGVRNDLGTIRDRRLGAGKENTTMIMRILDRSGGAINTAPWICVNLEVNGFNDWFMPSLDELILLYTNTYAKDGSGGFRSLKYRSSTFQSDGAVLSVDFSNGRDGTIDQSERDFVRAIRRF